ncbi:hypothetical protein pipiens_006068 [Culex pipiens pipiens]|uniref:Uncharacterized protein n=1 Tax=Culex pipiens pipiens TaxID=38569 RepID=A0ABD1DSP2_CULPP
MVLCAEVFVYGPFHRPAQDKGGAAVTQWHSRLKVDCPVRRFVNQGFIPAKRNRSRLVVHEDVESRGSVACYPGNRTDRAHGLLLLRLLVAVVTCIKRKVLLRRSPKE